MNATGTWLSALSWSAATIGLYLASKAVHRRVRVWWTAPLPLAPLVLLGFAALMGERYADYIRGTHWLVAMLAPTTVAFAVPIYRQRALILRQWRVVTLGVVVGSLTSFVSSWFLAKGLGLGDHLRLSLLPRSMSTPFAMIVSADIGGAPDLTAIFVLITGVLGATIGELLLEWLPLHTKLARGALFGMGAHGVGTAKAFQIDSEVGSVAGFVMIFVGLLNVLAAPLFAPLLARLG